MVSASREFVTNPFDVDKRSEMIKAARNLLLSVTRLLILADMIDVQLLLKTTKTVEADLEKLRVVSNYAELFKHHQNFQQNANKLFRQAAKRQQELLDPQIRDDLAAARAVLKKSSTMLLSATKAHIAHPTIAAAQQNRQHILKQICEAVETINKVAQGNVKDSVSSKYEQVGKLGTNLENFENIDVKYDKISLEKQLDEIIKGAKFISGAENIKNERREKILAGCDAVKEALQGLLSQSMKSVGSSEVTKAKGNISHKTKNLKRQLGKALADRITDAFATNDPFLDMYHAAQTGNIQKVEVCSQTFTEHCSKLIEVANQVCELSTNEDGVKMVRYAASQLDDLRLDVINAARILAEQPQSTDAQENMEIFKQAWENQVKILLEAVDDITTVDDVLSVLENYILDDMNQCLAALQGQNPEEIKEIVENIRGRAKRICDMVTAEMDNYEPCPYTRKVLEAIKVLNDKIKDFDKKTEATIKIMTDKPEEEIDENEFIDTTRLVYDGVREVRRAVLMNRVS